MEPAAKWRNRIGHAESDTVDNIPPTELSPEEWEMVRSFSWMPPYTAPPRTWSGKLPLRHCQRAHLDLCFLCGRCSTEGHLMSANHSRNMATWTAARRPALVIPHEQFSDRDRLEMALHANCPGLTDIQYQAAMERILQEEYYRGCRGSTAARSLQRSFREIQLHGAFGWNHRRTLRRKLRRQRRRHRRQCQRGKRRRRHQRW